MVSYSGKTPMVQDPLSTPTPEVLRMENIVKTFPGVRALNGVSIGVRPGEVLALMGENGAGKSTLMKVLAGAHPPDSGQILLDGSPVVLETPQKAMSLGISIIYQELNLVPQMTVAENIFLGREPQGRLRGWVDARALHDEAQQVMDALGAGVDVRKLVSQLPVAQQQMVEIAKATSRQSRVIAMDEPSAMLTGHDTAAQGRRRQHYLHFPPDGRGFRNLRPGYGVA